MGGLHRQVLKDQRSSETKRQAFRQSLWPKLCFSGLPRNGLYLVLLSHTLSRFCFALYTIPWNPGRCRHEMAKNSEMAARKLRRGSTSLYDLTDLEHILCHGAPPLWTATTAPSRGFALTLTQTCNNRRHGADARSCKVNYRRLIRVPPSGVTAFEFEGRVQKAEAACGKPLLNPS